MYQNTSNAYQIYQNNQVNTSSKGKLIIMLYDGALKFIRLAMIALKEKNIENTNKYLLRTQDILSELMITLNFEAGEISQNLYRLYDYMNNELIMANIEKDITKIRNVEELMEELRNSWAEII
jgi:flagellar protein FliS